MFKYTLEGNEVDRQALLNILGDSALRNMESEAYNLKQEEDETLSFKTDSGVITISYMG